MRYFLPLLLLTLSLFGYSQTPSTADMVTREIRMLEFIDGGSPLTPAERQQAAQVVALAMRTAPDNWRKVDVAEEKALAQIAQNNIPYNNAIREEIRYTYVFGTGESLGFKSEFAVEKQIIDAHDPVLIVDDAHRRVITQQMVPFIQQIAAWAAKEYGFPPPGANFRVWVMGDLREQFASLDTPIAEGFAHIERNAWFAPKFFDQMPEAQRTGFFTKNKDATFHNLNDPHSEQWQIAEAGAMIAGFAHKQVMAQAGQQGGQNRTAEVLFDQHMQQAAMQRAVRSFSPTCNVTVGSYASRAGNGCYPQ